MMRIHGLGVQLASNNALPTRDKIFMRRAFGRLQEQYLTVVFWWNVFKCRRFTDLLRGTHFRALGLVAGPAFEEFFNVFASVRKTDLYAFVSAALQGVAEIFQFELQRIAELEPRGVRSIEHNE